MSTPKFKVGEVAMWDRSPSNPRRARNCFPILILEVIEDDGAIFYRYDSKNALSETMLRKQTDLEKGNY